MRAHLNPHPDTHGGPAKNISVHVSRPGADVLVLRYTLAGALDRIALPAEVQAERADDLWRHTCFEAFIELDGGAYYEFNASPSRQWALYRFSAYRAGMEIAHELPPPVLSTQHTELFELTATLNLPNLPHRPRLALSAVIEGGDGAKSYWALAHPSGKPDFHHPHGFALDLPEPE
jgi:hypothetical protein